MSSRPSLIVAALAAGLALGLPAAALAAPADPTPSPGGVFAPPPPDPPPSITGSTQEGGALTGSQGTWAPSTTLSNQWLRCAPDLSACETTGNTDLSYALTASDVGKVIRLRVTGQSPFDSREADSNDSAVITAAPVAPAGPTGTPPKPTPTTPSTPTAPAATLKKLSPFPLLLIGGRVSGGVTVFASVRLRRVPKGATVAVACVGRDCPYSRSTVKQRRGSTMTLRRLQRNLRAGTVITITVRKGTTLGKYTRLRIRRGLAPARSDRCVKPGSSRPVPCS